jgi:hypothetical protein
MFDVVSGDPTGDVKAKRVLTVKRAWPFNAHTGPSEVAELAANLCLLRK